MVLALLLLSVAGVVLAVQAARPATTGSRHRAAVRRARFVAAHPTHANDEDIVVMLRGDGMSAARASALMARARVLGITPFTMWLWCERSGAESLGLVVAADLSHQELLVHLGRGTAPAMHEAEIFAVANGWEPVESGDAAPVSTLRPYVFGRTRRAA